MSTDAAPLRRRLPLALGLLATILSWGLSSASAQPTVRVRGESRIELGAEPGSDAILLRGTLRDDLGTPLPGRTIVLRVDADGVHLATLEAATSTTGEFEALAPAGHPSLRVGAFFAGDPSHEGIHVERRIDARIADVRLSLAVPDAGHLDLDRPQHAIRVVATSRAPVVDLEVEIRDELDRVLASSRTDSQGAVEFTLPSAELGSPGAGRLMARSSGDERRAPAQTEVALVRYRRTTTTLSGSTDQRRLSAPPRVEGTLGDSRGPLPGRAIGLFAGTRHLGTALTDADGRFEREIPLEEGEAIEVVAVFESASPGLVGSRSEPLRLTMMPTPRTPLIWLMLSVVVTLLLLWASSRREGKAPRRARRGASIAPPGVEASTRRGRRAIHSSISGRVVDHRDGGAVLDARIVLEGPSGRELPLSADDEGRFESPELDPGSWALRVMAPGYLTISSTLAIPHRGEWKEATVRLASLRARAMDAFRELAIKLLPSERLWPTSTTREIVDRSPDLLAGETRELEEDVDRAYYGPLPPTADEVAAIEENTSTIAAKLPERGDVR